MIRDFGTGHSEGHILWRQINLNQTIILFSFVCKVDSMSWIWRYGKLALIFLSLETVLA